jgi:hypothetical protein
MTVLEASYEILGHFQIYAESPIFQGEDEIHLGPGVRDDLESSFQGRIDAGGVSFRGRRPFVRADSDGDDWIGHLAASASSAAT